jgi:hypothetical protein
MMENSFYVYEHWRPDKDICFYVGKGIESRVRTKKRRNRHHRDICNYLSSIGTSLEVRIIGIFKSEAEALKMEVERISFWRRNGVKLANVTNGGDGTVGFKHSAVSKERMSRASTGRPGVKSMLGKKHTPEAIKKISDHNKGRIKSPETREKLSISKKGKPSPFFGVKRDRSVVLKIADALRGKPLSAEHRAKLSIARRKRPPPSAETRAKLSAASLRRWGRQEGDAR